MRISFVGKRQKSLSIAVDIITVVAFAVFGAVFISSNIAGSSASGLPSRYDLRDSSTMVPLKNQGDLGLCWAYATLTSTESFLIENGISSRQDPTLLSEFQLDYALSNNGMEGFKLPYNSVDRPLQGGGHQAFWWLKSGYSPALLSEFGKEYYDQEGSNKLSVEDVIKKQQHAIVDYDHITDTATKTKEQLIKEHIMKDGAVYVDTSMTANCMVDVLSKPGPLIQTDGFLIDYSPACNQYGTWYATNQMHAMTIIGWDDNYAVTYCNDAPTSLDYRKSNFEMIMGIGTCNKTHTIVGAWILQNSWGETVPYPYLSYDSKADFYAPAKYLADFDKVDTIYSQTSILSHRIDDGVYIATFQSSESTCDQGDGCEAIIGLNFENQADSEYDIFISPTGQDADFTFVKTITEELEGAAWVDVPNFKIPNAQFSIKIAPKNDTFFIKYPQVNIFSVNMPSAEDSTTINASLKNDNIYPYTDSISLHVSTHLYPQNEDVKDMSIKFLDPQGNDITSIFTLANIYNIDNDLFTDYQIGAQLNYEYITARISYPSISHQTQTTSTKDFRFSITNLAKISEQGTGTVNDPYIITTPEQLVAIGSREEYMKAHYILGADIDLADYLAAHGYNFAPIGTELDKSFSGSIDGRNHSIKNLKISISNNNINSGLFNSLKNADIKNLILYDFELFGNYVGALAPRIESSSISNISIYDSSFSGKVVGSVAGFSAEDSMSTYHSIFSNSTINCKKDEDNAMCGGLVGEAYLDEFNGNVFAGVINTEGAYSVGGIIGHSGFNAFSNALVYNYEQWNTGAAVYAGIVAGNSRDDTWSTVVVNDGNSNSSSPLFSNAENVSLENSYIVNRTPSDAPAIFQKSKNSSFENVTVLSAEQTPIAGNYKFLDFAKVWEIRSGFPMLQGLGFDYYPNSIGTSEKYIIEPGRHIISNVKVYPDTRYITREQFISNFTTFNGAIYDRDGVTEITSPSAKLTSGMFVKNNDDTYIIAIIGNCHSSIPSLNAADIICMRRKLGGVEVDSVPDEIFKDTVDLNKDGEFDITDVVILRRALTKGYPVEEGYVYEQV